ncbi:MAG: lipoyl synthase [Phycisphaerae bacterium]|nr:MAG: lipoyl synthase [Phycisphaerae bacterium]
MFQPRGVFLRRSMGPGLPDPYTSIPVTPDPTQDSPTARTLARHPRPLGGDPLRTIDPPKLSLSDRVLNNREGKETLAVRRKPDWLRAKVPGGPGYTRLKAIMAEHRLHTVCEEAGCPNMGECWSRGVSTIMILGDTCTRACGFCNVKTGRPKALDRDEPRRVAESLALMGLKHVVITSVNRDELPDGGAAIWAETIIRTRESCPTMSIEVLIPDFEGNHAALQMVIDAKPHIINHNLETVRRMYPAVRPSAKFDRSLELLRRVKEAGMVAKTGIMLGIGERDDEVLALMDEVQQATRPSQLRHSGTSELRNSGTSELRNSGTSELPSCDILTLGQYLQPTRNHLPIDRWVHPDTFARFKAEGLARGFKVVESGPLVRSSYHADHQADVLTTITAARAQTSND